MSNFEFDNIKDILGEPQIYKDIKLYPMKILDIEKMKQYLFIMNINKNILKDENIISSSYLKFLLLYVPFICKEIKYIYNEKDNIKLKNNKIKDFIVEFLSEITKVNKENIIISKTIKNNREKIEILLNINGIHHVIRESDFTKIKDIFLKQHGINKSELKIYDEKLQKYLDEALEAINKNNNSAEFYELIAIYHVATGVSYSEIKEYTYRQFIYSIKRMTIFIEYKLLQPLISSGQISLKNGSTLPHYLDHLKEDTEYGKVISKASDLTKKVEGVSRK